MSVFNDYDELTWVATIVGAHGIKGAVRVKYFTDTPDYYLNVELFFLEFERQLQSLKVLQIRPTKSGWIVLFGAPWLALALLALIPVLLLKSLKAAAYYCRMIS